MSTHPPAAKSKVTLYVTLAVVIAALTGGLIGGYQIGVGMQQPAIDEARADATAAEDANAETSRELAATQQRERAASAQADAARAALTAWERRGRALEARRRLSLAIEQLDARNFGIAQDHLRAAGAALEGETDSDLSQLAGELSGVTLEIGPNVAEHRELALHAAHRVDEALPLILVPELEEPAAEEPTDEAPAEE